MRSEKYLILGLILLVLLLTSVLFMLREDSEISISGSVTSVSEEGRNFDSDCVSEVKEYVVSGSSMSPYVESGDSVYASLGYYDCNPVLRGEMVFVNFSWRERPLLKFVRGVPGDSFGLAQVEEGFDIMVNGEALINSEGESYTISGKKKDMLDLYINDYEGIIPPGTYLLLGDSERGSLDSTRFGLIDKSNIAARGLK